MPIVQLIKTIALWSMRGTYHCACFSTCVEILACPIRLTQILQKETQKGKKHKVLHSKEVKKAITSIKQMKARTVRASERQVKNNEANPRQATRKRPKKASQLWLIECIGDRSRTTIKNRTRQRIKWCPMWDNTDEEQNDIWWCCHLQPCCGTIPCERLIPISSTCVDL